MLLLFFQLKSYRHPTLREQSVACAVYSDWPYLNAKIVEKEEIAKGKLKNLLKKEKQHLVSGCWSLYAITLFIFVVIFWLYKSYPAPWFLPWLFGLQFCQSRRDVFELHAGTLVNVILVMQNILYIEL